MKNMDRTGILEVVGRVFFFGAGSPQEIQGVISNTGQMPLRVSRGLFRHNETVNIECIESPDAEMDHSGTLTLDAEDSSADRGSLTLRSRNIALRGDISVVDGQRRQSCFTLHLGEVENESSGITELSALRIQLVGDADTRGYILRIPSDDPTDWRIQLGDEQSDEQELPWRPHTTDLMASYQPAGAANRLRTITVGRVYASTRQPSSIRH